ncbi:MAG: GAF domain-containing protein [Alphaproteobacteria bacterium]
MPDDPLAGPAAARQDDDLAERLAMGDRALAENVLAELRQSRLMNRIADVVSAAGGLDAILPELVGLIAAAVGADRASLFLHDGETKELFSRVATGDGVREIRFPDSSGVAGAVYRNGAAELIDDAYADPRFNQAVDKATGYRTRTILAAPVRTVDGRIVGVVQALNRRDGPFGSGERDLLEAMARQAAAALERAWLTERLERAKRDEARMLEIAEWISGELDLDRLLSRIGAATTELLNCERATIFVHDPAAGELVSRQASGGEVAEIRIPETAGIAGDVFVTRRIDNVPDAYADKRFNQAVDRKTGFHTRSILAAPIKDRAGLPVGVIQALNKRGGAFGPDDERRVSAFSAQLAVALQNAQLFSDVLALKNYNESILKSLSNGVVTLDAKGRVVKANEAAGRILGLDLSEGANAPHEADVLFCRNEWALKSIDYVARTGADEYHADTDYKLPNGEKVAVNLTISPLTGVDGESLGCVLAFEDITAEKRVRSAMARYMAKEVVDRLLEQNSLSLGGESVVATALFSDIRRFTSLAEGMTAQGVVELLNEYFTDMVEVIFKRNGVLDKYIGDAIMAVFGAPVKSGRHADDAVLTAIEMQRALRLLNVRRRERGQPLLEIGVGLCTGEMLSGSIGSEKRLEYTVIGDSVNLASRLEGANKHYGTNILMADTTASLLSEPYVTRPIDLIRVKGRMRPVEVVEALDHVLDEEGDALRRMLDRYESAVVAYRARDWRAAIQGFAQTLELRPHDGPAKVYLNRCRYYQDQPPPEEWDGVWQISEK